MCGVRVRKASLQRLGAGRVAETGPLPYEKCFSTLVVNNSSSSATHLAVTSLWSTVAYASARHGMQIAHCKELRRRKEQRQAQEHRGGRAHLSACLLHQRRRGKPAPKGVARYLYLAILFLRGSPPPIPPLPPLPRILRLVLVVHNRH